MSPDSSTVRPNYIELVRFLVTPFLEFPESLVVDCEISGARHRVLVRIAFASSDKGRVFGRGGRTLQAIRTVLEAAATLEEKSAYLEVFGERDTAVEHEAPPRPKSDVPRPRPQLRKAGAQTHEG
jgi:uncharacterized protein